MAWTSVLGSADSVLGLSLRLGAPTESGDTGSKPSATNTINLSHEAAAELIVFNVDAESEVELDHTAIGWKGVLNNSELSALSLTQTATGVLRVTHRKSATNTLVFTQTIAHNQKFGPAESELRLAQTAEQRGPLPQAALNLIELSDSAYVPQTFELDVESELALTQLVVYSGPIPVSAASKLVIVQSVDSTPDKFRDAESTLSLTSEATGDAAKNARNTLTLTQLAVGNTTQRITSALTLDHAVDVGKPIYVDASSALVEYDEVFDQETLEFVTTQTGLSSEAAAALLTNPRIRQYIQLAHSATRSLSRADGTSVEAKSELTLNGKATISNPREASNSLSLLHTAAAQVAQHQPENTLELSQTSTVAINRAAMALESALSVQQAVRFVITRSAVTCKYSPFVGASTDPDAPRPPSTTLPVASGLTGFRLLYPASGAPTKTLLLRSPNLGNIDRLSFDRINRETRGGTLVIYADPIWPKIETLLLTFSALKRDEADDLLEFMEDTIGQQIRMIDWENRAWRGVIVNPQDPIVEDRRNSFTASFEFEGQREITGEITLAATSSLSLSSTASRVATRSYALASSMSLASTASGGAARSNASTSAISLSSVADNIFLHPLRTGDGEILLTGDGEPLEAS